MFVSSSLSIELDNMMSEWGDVPYAELSILLVHLRFLALVHQTNHWVAKGDSYYGDHLLFERLYDSVVKEIDQTAEKVIAFGTETNVNMNLQVVQLNRLVQNSQLLGTFPSSAGPATASLASEKRFLEALEYLVQSLKERQMLTLGIENMLTGIADKHEESVYLLKRRVG